jgi:TonB family protein
MRAILTIAFIINVVAAQDSTQPTDWKGWLEKGGSDFRSARYADAVAAFQQAADLNPEDPRPRLFLANACIAQYVPGAASPQNKALGEKARAELGRVLQSNPKNMAALRALGSLSLQEAQVLTETNKLTKLDDARDWFHRLIEVDAQAKDAFYSLGLIDSMKFGPAWEAARAQLGMKLEDPGPLSDPAVRQDLVHKYGSAVDSAATNLTNALEIESDYAEALQTMSFVWRVRADLDDSPAQYRSDIAQANQWAEKAKSAQKTRNPDRLRVDGSVQAGRLVSKVDPVYPASAAQQHIQGTVQLRAIIDQSGHVASTQFVSGPAELVAAAQEAVKKWTYQPTGFNGQPVEVLTYIEVNFILH